MSLTFLSPSRHSPSAPRHDTALPFTIARSLHGCRSFHGYSNEKYNKEICKSAKVEEKFNSVNKLWLQILKDGIWLDMSRKSYPWLHARSVPILTGNTYLSWLVRIFLIIKNRLYEILFWSRIVPSLKIFKIFI